MSAGEVLLAATLPLLLGWGLLASLGLHARHDRLAYLGWLLMAGALGTALVLVGWLLLGGAPDSGAVGAVAAVSLGLVALGRRTRAAPRPEALPPAPGWQRATFALALLGTLGLGLQTVASGDASALATGDDAMFWALKAKLLYAGGGLGPEFRQLAQEQHQPASYWEPLDHWLEARVARDDQGSKKLAGASGDRAFHQDYPLLNPLLQLWVYTCAGEITPWQNKLPIQLLGLALLLVLAGALRQCAPPLPAAALLVMVFALQESRGALRYAYVDGMLATGLLLAADGLRRRLRDPSGAWLALGSLGLAFMVWSKHEALLPLGALGLGLLVVRPLPLKRVAPALLPALVLLVLTWSFNASFGFYNDLATQARRLDPDRIATVLDWFAHRIWSVPGWADDATRLRGNGLLAACLALFLLSPRESSRGWSGVVAVALAVIVLGQLLVYLATPHDVLWHLATSARRLGWQLLPLAALWVGAWSGRQRRIAAV